MCIRCATTRSAASSIACTINITHCGQGVSILRASMQKTRYISTSAMKLASTPENTSSCKRYTPMRKPP